MSATVSATSPRFALDKHSGQIARALMAKQHGRRRSLSQDEHGVRSPRELEAPDFLRREASLEAVLRHGFHKGSPRAALETSDPLEVDATQLERGGFGGGSLSLDFLRRESSLEALRFITSSPSRFGLEAAPSRGVSMEWPKTPQSRSTPFEDRTGNPLMSLVSAAGMQPPSGNGANYTSSNSSAAQASSSQVKEKNEVACSDSKQSQLHRKNSPHSDDSDSDDGETSKHGHSRSGFPKPDFEIFQRGPPPIFPHSRDDDGNGFEDILDLGADEQASDSDVAQRLHAKKAKRAAASAVFANAIADAPQEGPLADIACAGPSSASLSGTTGPKKMVGRLTPEERKQRIAKFMDKRTRRKWGRKVEYECRKKLAVQRVRIHGRFA